MEDSKDSEPVVSDNNTPTENNKIQTEEQDTGSKPAPSILESSILSSPAISTKTARPKLKKLVIIILVILLVAAGALAYLKFYKKDMVATQNNQTNHNVSISRKDLPLVDTTSFADKFLPDYSDMRGYTEMGSEHWFVAFKSIIVTKDGKYRVYTTHEFDGITSFTGIVKMDGQIWISGQGGTARYDSKNDSFKTYLKGELNVKLYVDPFDSNMYAATFKTAYAYDKKSNTFSLINPSNNPSSIKEFGFTKDYVVATSSNNSENNSPLQVLNKQTRRWSAPSGLQYFKANARSAEVSLVTVGDKIIVYGRHVEYQSCAGQGKYPATVVYQFTETGSFEELKDLTTLFSNNEANGYAYSSTALTGGSCGDNASGKFVVDLKVENGKVVATNKRKLDIDSGTSFYTYQDRMDQLEKELGFAPKLIFVHPATDGSIFSVWQSSKSSSLVSTKGAYKDLKKRGTFEKSGVLAYVECAGGQYVIDSTSKYGAFGPPFLNAVLKLENNSSSIVYTTTNKPLYEGVDAEVALANSEAVCVDGSLVMLGPSQLITFDTKAKTLKKQDLGNNTEMDLSIVNKARTGFSFVDTQQSQLVSIGASVAQKKSVPFAKSALGPMESVSTKLFVFNENQVVIAQSSYKQGDGSRIVTLKSQDGAMVESTKVTKNIYDGLAYDDARFILQYGDGETKIINNATHKGDTISKPASIISDNFSILKDANSEFVSADGYVWFSAENWGIIGYKVP